MDEFERLKDLGKGSFGCAILVRRKSGKSFGKLFKCTKGIRLLLKDERLNVYCIQLKVRNCPAF